MAKKSITFAKAPGPYTTLNSTCVNNSYFRRSILREIFFASKDNEDNVDIQVAFTRLLFKGSGI